MSSRRVADQHHAAAKYSRRTLEVVAPDVRRALILLDQALLSEAPGEVLDLIFSRFCIGK